ncbi:MAG: ribosome maturation factor RimM [Alphaproteobacteria bacterium]
MDRQRKICVGKITGAHGLRGLVRLRSFTENPEAIAAYALTGADGKPVKVTLKSPMGEEFIAEIEGVNTRHAAQAMRGAELFTDRDALPPAGEREYYRADLVGLRVEDAAGAAIGTIIALHDFGAGSFLEIKLTGGNTAMLPFRDAFVPTVDIAAGRVVVTPPADWLETPKQESQGKGAA